MKNHAIRSVFTGVLLFAAAVTFTLYSCGKKVEPTDVLKPVTSYVGTWQTQLNDTMYYLDNGCSGDVGPWTRISRYTFKWTWYITKGANDNEVNILASEDNASAAVKYGTCGPCYTGNFYHMPMKGTISGTKLILNFGTGGSDKLSGSLNMTNDIMTGDVHDTVTCPNSSKGITSVWETGKDGMPGLHFTKVN